MVATKLSIVASVLAVCVGVQASYFPRAPSVAGRQVMSSDTMTTTDSTTTSTTSSTSGICTSTVTTTVTVSDTAVLPTGTDTDNDSDRTVVRRQGKAGGSSSSPPARGKDAGPGDAKPYPGFPGFPRSPSEE